MNSSYLRNSRYLTKARAAYAARVVAAGAMVAAPSACGPGDTAAFSSTTPAVSNAALATTSPPTTAGSPPPIDGTTTVPATTNTPTTAPTTAGSAVAQGASLNLNFTYQPSATGGRVHNPYIAAWVEDDQGRLVQTIALWYEDTPDASKHLADLAAWYSAAQGAEVTTSGATRAPGTYSLSWDGTDILGARAPAGTYSVFVESAREKGPYSITSTQVTLDGSTTAVELPDNGELTDVSLSL